MRGIFDNVRRKIYPEVEIDDDLGGCLGLGLSGCLSLGVGVVAFILAVMVGVNDAGSGFFMGAGYVEMVCWRSR